MQEMIKLHTQLDDHEMSSSDTLVVVFGDGKSRFISHITDLAFVQKLNNTVYLTNP